MKRLALLSMLCVGCGDSEGGTNQARSHVYQPIRVTTERTGDEMSLAVVEVDYGGETHAFLWCGRHGKYDNAIAKIGAYPSKAPVPPKP